MSDTPTSERSAGVDWPAMFNVLMMILGAAGLWWLLHGIGWARVIAMIFGVGGWFPVLVAIDLLALLCHAAALHTFMRPEARMVSYWRVLGAQASGRAVNVLTPGGAMGEATKLTLLLSHAPRARVLSSVVLLNVTHVYVSVAVILLGTPITLLRAGVPDGIEVMIWGAFLLLVPLVVGLALLVHRGATSSVVGLLRALRLLSPARAATWRAKLAEVDDHIREVHRNRSAGTWKGVLWVVLSRLIAWAGVVVMLYALDVPITSLLVLGLLSIGVLITTMAAIVPMGLGLEDGGNYLLFELLGAAGPQGVLTTMVNRARSLTVAVLGLNALAVLTLSNRITVMRMRRKLKALRADAAANGR